MTYDAWGRLVKVVNGGNHYYVYDALGRRVQEYNAEKKRGRESFLV